MMTLKRIFWLALVLLMLVGFSAVADSSPTAQGDSSTAMEQTSAAHESHLMQSDEDRYVQRRILLGLMGGLIAIGVWRCVYLSKRPAS
jgi:hypothetical protein